MNTNIPNDIKFKFGNGEIRYEENGKYYHGVGPPSISCKYLIKHNTPPNMFFQYPRTHKLPHKQWDTYCGNCFCHNNLCDPEWSKRRRIVTVFKCNGHTL